MYPVTSCSVLFNKSMGSCVYLQKSAVNGNIDPSDCRSAHTIRNPTTFGVTTNPNSCCMYRPMHCAARIHTSTLTCTHTHTLVSASTHKKYIVSPVLMASLGDGICSLHDNRLEPTAKPLYLDAARETTQVKGKQEGSNDSNVAFFSTSIAVNL